MVEFDPQLTQKRNEIMFFYLKILYFLYVKNFVLFCLEKNGCLRF